MIDGSIEGYIKLGWLSRVLLKPTELTIM